MNQNLDTIPIWMPVQLGADVLLSSEPVLLASPLNPPQTNTTFSNSTPEFVLVCVPKTEDFCNWEERPITRGS